jgi:hypothetical protein
MMKLTSFLSHCRKYLPMCDTDTEKQAKVAARREEWLNDCFKYHKRANPFGYDGEFKPTELGQFRHLAPLYQEWATRDVDNADACLFYHYPKSIYYVHVSPVGLKYNRKNNANFPCLVLYDKDGIVVGHFHNLCQPYNSQDMLSSLAQVNQQRLSRFSSEAFRSKKVVRPANIEGIVYQTIYGSVVGAIDVTTASRVYTDKEE